MTTRRTHIAVIVAVLLSGSFAWATSNYPINTAGGTRTVLKSTDNAGVHTPHVNVDTLGAPASDFPSGATPISASGTGTTGATAATLAASATKTTYICGFSVRSNATAAATGNITITGTITGTLNFTHWAAPLASGIGVTEPPLTRCIPGSAVNTAIVVTGPAPGTGGVISTTAWGYQL